MTCENCHRDATVVADKPWPDTKLCDRCAGIVKRMHRGQATITTIGASDHAVGKS